MPKLKKWCKETTGHCLTHGTEMNSLEIAKKRCYVGELQDEVATTRKELDNATEFIFNLGLTPSFSKFISKGDS